MDGFPARSDNRDNPVISPGGNARTAEIEATLRSRRYKEALFSRFAKAVVKYQLVQPGDRIAVCISGGKDSMLMAKLFQQLRQCREAPFSLTFLAMDPGYSPPNRQAIADNAALLGLPLTIFDSPIFNSVYGVEKNPCYLCARMRRGYLYQKAQELGCNKIALGHHYDDVIETILMGLLWSGQVQTMLPKLHSRNFPGMELIRPMYFVREADICAWRDRNQLHFLQCACRFTEAAARETGTSRRAEIKQLIRELKKENPQVEANIFNSVCNVNLDTLLSWRRGAERHNFLDDYDSGSSGGADGGG